MSGRGNRDFNIEDARAFFGKFVGFYGQDWLEEKEEAHSSSAEDRVDEGQKIGVVESPHKAVLQYKKGKRELGYEEEELPEWSSKRGFSDPTKKAVHLGRALSDLADIGFLNEELEEVESTIQQRYRDRLINSDYSTTISEILVAAEYNRGSHKVYFIEEGKSKTPDLAIKKDGEFVFVEIKSCRQLSNKEAKTENITSEIMKYTFSQLSFERFIAFYQFERDPLHEDFQNLSENFPSRLDIGKSYEFPFGKLYIFSYLEDEEIFSLPTGGLDLTDVGSLFYDYYIRPVLKINLSMDLNLYETIPGHAEILSQSDGVRTWWKEPKWIGVYRDRRRDPVNRILNQFEAARGKFDKKNPNILHIDRIPRNSLDENSEIALRDGLGKKLYNNSRIGAAVLSWQNHTDNGISRSYQITPNHNPYVEFPDGFQLLNQNMNNLRKEMSENHNTKTD